MNLKWLKTYLYFSRKERRGFLVLMLLIVIFAISPRLFPFLIKPKQPSIDIVFLEQMATIRQSANNDVSNVNPDDVPASESSYNKEAGIASSELHPQFFDPNTVSEAVLLQMGLRPKLVRTLVNYRNKGGRFRKPSDLTRIYGMDKKTFVQLVPFVSIAEQREFHSPHDASTPFVRNVQPSTKKESPSFRIDINTADTSTWKRLPGIGSRLAQRIVQFRNKLGGFVSIDQVAETYALPDTTFQLIRNMLESGNGEVRKLNINTASLQELTQHPYISFAVAKSIVAYRMQNGYFDKPQALLRIMLVSDSLFAKISPYLTAEFNKTP